MIRTVKIWLNRPYFFNLSTSFRFLISLSFGVFVFSFLYFLTPFNLLLLEEHLLEYVTGIGLIVFLSLLFLFFVLPYVFKSFFKPETWTIWRNVIFIIIVLFTTSISTWYFNYKVKASYGMEVLSLSKFIYYTFVVGLFPSIMVIFFNERSVRLRKIKRVEELLLGTNQKINERENEVIFTSDSTNKSLNIPVEKIVFITSQANYACIFINKNNIIKEYIIRTTLKKIEQSLLNYNEFYRCHKSYIINSNYVQSLEGNARGYVLLLSTTDIKIPVSRSFPKELLKNILK